MSNLNELQEHALTASSLLKHIDPSYFHYNQFSNFVIFGDFDQYKFTIPAKNKKHFGYQTILEAIAKVNGYSTYKGLIADATPSIAPNSLSKALISLNPYPRSISQSKDWTALMSDLSANIKRGFHPKTFHFHKHEESAYLHFLGMGMFKELSEHSSRIVGRNRTTTDDFSIEVIATSIFLKALKGKVIPCHGEFGYKEKLGMTVIGYLAAPFLLNACIDTKDWPKKDFVKLKKKLIPTFLKLFNAEINFFESFEPNKDPLYQEVQVKFPWDYDLDTKYSYLKNLYNEKNRIDALQSIAKDLASNKGISEDTALYTHPDWKGPLNPTSISHPDLRHLISSSMQELIPHKRGFYGTKLFWINIAPTLLNFSSRRISDPNEMRALIENEILAELIPIKQTQKEYAYQYHFNLNFDYHSLDYYLECDTHLIPQHMTIVSDYPLMGDIALLMVQAELNKITGNHINKLYGNPRQYRSSQDELSPWDTAPIVVNIRKQKNLPKKSYTVVFKPEAIIKSIELECYSRNEAGNIYEMDLTEPFYISIELIDTLHNVGVFNDSFLVHEITAWILLSDTGYRQNLSYYPDDLNLTFYPDGSNVLKKLSSSQMFLSKENFLYEPFTRNIMNQFLKTMTEIIKKEISRDRESFFSGQSIKAHPHECYVFNQPLLDSQGLMLVDIT